MFTHLPDVVFMKLLKYLSNDDINEMKMAGREAMEQIHRMERLELYTPPYRWRRLRFTDDRRQYTGHHMTTLEMASGIAEIHAKAKKSVSSINHYNYDWRKVTSIHLLNICWLILIFHYFSEQWTNKACSDTACHRGWKTNSYHKWLTQTYNLPSNKLELRLKRCTILNTSCKEKWCSILFQVC